MTFFKTFQTFLRVVHVSHISLNFLSPQDFGYSQRSHFCSRFCFYSRSHCLKITNTGRPWSAKVTPALNVLLWPWFIPYLRKEGGKVVIIFFPYGNQSQTVPYGIQSTETHTERKRDTERRFFRFCFHVIFSLPPSFSQSQTWCHKAVAQEHMQVVDRILSSVSPIFSHNETVTLCQACMLNFKITFPWYYSNLYVWKLLERSAQWAYPQWSQFQQC